VKQTEVLVAIGTLQNQMPHRMIQIGSRTFSTMLHPGVVVVAEVVIGPKKTSGNRPFVHRGRELFQQVQEPKCLILRVGYTSMVLEGD